MDNKFDSYRPLELLAILRHLKLGRSHIKKILLEEEFQELINLIPIPKSSLAAPLKNKEFLNPFNGMLTAVLGAWVGFSSFLEFNINSLPLFYTILSLGVIIGSTVAWQNTRIVKQAINDWNEDRKIEALQKYIINKLQINRKKEIDEKIQDLHKVAGKKVKIESLLKQKEKIEYPISIEKLLSSKDTHIPHPSWMKANLRTIIISFIPALIGGFASFSFYLPTIPLIAKEFGQNRIVEILTRPEAKTIQIIIVIGITLYLAINSLITNRQAYKRDKKIKKVIKEISKMENELAFLDDRLLKIKEALRGLQ